jgi:CRP/FNR family cyclic AMP-dependent transcriptional regulator
MPAMHGDEHRALMACGIFSTTEPAVVAALMKQTRSVCFPPGRIVFAQGEPGDCLYVVVSGKAKVSYLHTDGREFVLNLVGAFDVFGELTPFDCGAREATVTALTEVRAVEIDRDRLLDWVADCPEAIHQIMRLLARRAEMMTSSLADFAICDPTQRIARRILLLAKRFGMREGDDVRVVHDMTVEVMSRYAGVAPQRIDAALCVLRDRGLIRFEDSCVVIVDGQGLAAVAGKTERSQQQ